MFGILGIGFLLGMQHALEADHIAAVSSIAARRTDVRDIIKHGLTWGLGHTLTLFVFAGAAIVLGHAIPEHLARPLETAVSCWLASALTYCGGCGATVCIFIGMGTAMARNTFMSTATRMKRSRIGTARTRISMAFAGARCSSV